MSEVDSTKPVAVKEDKLATEYLANERTFLAWIRTSIAVVSLGFVTARFGIWLREIGAELTHGHIAAGAGLSVPMGATLMGLGGLLATLAAWRYHVVVKQIQQGQVLADRGLVYFITAMVALLSFVMIGFLLATQH
jgi:putative membrane protein